MILHEIRVRDWGPFREETALEELSPGLNLLVGANETGKSTLVEAVARALFDRHGSTAVPLKALRPWGTDLGPAVEVEATIDGRRYRVEKRFLEAPRAVLSERRNGSLERLAEGRAAEERLDTILGFARARGASKPEHRGLAEVLWVPQGGTTDAGEGPYNEPTRARLRTALDATVEAGAPGAIARRVRELHEEHYTPTGRPKRRGELAELEAGLEGARRERDEAAGRLRALEERRLELECAREDRDGLAAALAEAEEDLAAATAEDREARSARTELAEARTEAGTALAAWREANERVRDVRRVREEVTRLEADLDAAREEAEELAARFEAARTAAALAALREIAARRERVEGAIASLARADEREDDARALDAPDAAALDRIRRLEADIAAVREADSGREAEIRLEPAAELTGTVDAGGAEEPLAAGPGEVLAWETAAPFRLSVEGFGTIHVIPPGAEETDAKLSRLAEERGSLSPEPLEELERRFAEARSLREEARRRRDRAEGVLGGGADAEAILRDLDSREAALHEDHPELPDDPTEAEIADLDVEACRREHGAARERLAGLEAALDAAHRARDEVLADGLEDDDREAILLERREALDLAEQRVKVLEGKARDVIDVAALEGEVADLRGRLRNADEVVHRRDQVLQERLDEGPSTRLRLAEEALAGLEARRRSVEARVHAVHLLHEVVEAHRRRTLEQVMAPVLERVRSDLAGVAPRYESVEVDPATQRPLSVRLRDGEEAPALERLSFGTREQILLLVRLALGEVVAADERELVVLDDALVNTDEERRAVLLARLREASEKLQVLVLTCHAEHYEPLRDAARVFELEAVRGG